MIKKYRRMILLTGAVTVLPMLVGVLFWSRLPERMPIHFGVSGEVDGYSSRTFAVLGLPLFLLAMHLFCSFVTLLDPRQKNISSKMLTLVFWICPLVSWFCAVLVYSTALGIQMDVLKAVDIFMAVLFIALGNYMPKCRQNYTVGIKLPWTLADPENWNRTHRVGGWLFVLAGLFWLLDIFIGVIWIPLAATILAALIPCVYSLGLYLKKQK
ncbi:MAG: SdpI family protein [Lachnospiraceae bacterium]|nr:SdpI family protein [Lachnospiraceae bacterium]